jgi:recombination protein RecR
MSTFNDPVSKLIYELSKLPGIGERSATRLAYYILKQNNNYAKDLAEALIYAKESIRLCSVCFTFTDLEICSLCQSSKRNKSIICVVEKPSDAHAIEQTGAYQGLYHILHGSLSPLEGIGPDQLKIKELLKRLTTDVQELILAMNPSVEGEATALYISRLVKPLGVHSTQLAYGIPMGGQLEYTDRHTLGKAFEKRSQLL